MSTSAISLNVPAPAIPLSDLKPGAGDASSDVNNTATNSGNTQFASPAKSLADISADFHPGQYEQANDENEIASNIPTGGNDAGSENSYNLAFASDLNAKRSSVGTSQDVALSLQAAKPKFVDIEIQQGGFFGMGSETVKGQEIASPKWYSESTGEYAKLTYPLYDDKGKLKSQGSFQTLGCHATGILNAANIVSGRVSGETATPRNARDYVVTSLDEKRNGVVNNVAGDNKYTGDKYRKVLNNVQFYDLRSPQKFTKIATDKLFTTEMKPSTITTETMDRIKANVRAGNPVTIGIAQQGEQVRHTAVISGIVTDKSGKEQLMVRDNWQDNNSQAAMITLDQFASKYQWGANADTVKVDMVWAAAPKNK